RPALGTACPAGCSATSPHVWTKPSGASRRDRSGSGTRRGRWMLDAVWGEVRRQLGACRFAKDSDTWIAPLRATCFEAGELTIEVPSAFSLEWIREHHLDALTQAIEGVAGPGTRVRFVVNRALEAGPPPRRPPRRAEGLAVASSPPPPPRGTF